MAINAKLGDFTADSYVSVVEANTYFSGRTNTDNWDNIATSAKEVALKTAARDIDAFNFVGDKYYDAQTMQFPRDSHEVVTGNCATAQGESTATLIDSITFYNANLKSDTYGEIPDNYWQYGSCHLTDDHLVETIASSNRTGIVHMENAFTASLTTSTKFTVFAPLYSEIKDAQCEQTLFLLDNPSLDTIQSYKSVGSTRVKIGDVDVTLSSANTSKITISPVAKKLLSRFIERSMSSARA